MSLEKGLYLNNLNRHYGIHLYRLYKKDIPFIRIQLPVPPSTNQRQTIGYKKIGYSKKPFLTHTKLARDYLEQSIILGPYIKSTFHKPIEKYEWFSFKFYLMNMNYDVHNGFKLVCDLLEQSGAVKNDRYILPVTEMPEKDVTNPRLIVDFPHNKFL